MAQFFDLMESQGWILTLPAGADAAHVRVFEGCLTPAKRSLKCEKNDGLLGERRGKTVIGEENRDAQVGRPVKRMKITKMVQADGVGDPGGPRVLERRPVLQDLMRNEC